MPLIGRKDLYNIPGWHTRRHLAATPVFKGIPNFRETRIRMLRAEKADELIRILEECRVALR